MADNEEMTLTEQDQAEVQQMIAREIADNTQVRLVRISSDIRAGVYSIAIMLVCVVAQLFVLSLILKDITALLALLLKAR